MSAACTCDYGQCEVHAPTAATTLLVIEGPDTYRRTFVPPGVGRIEVYVGVDGVTFRFDGEEVEDDDE